MTKREKINEMRCSRQEGVKASKTFLQEMGDPAWTYRHANSIIQHAFGRLATQEATRKKSQTSEDIWLMGIG